MSNFVVICDESKMMMISKKETDLIDDILVSEYIKDSDERIRTAQTNNRRSSILDNRRREYGRYYTSRTPCPAWRCSKKSHCSVATCDFDRARPPPPLAYQWRRTVRIIWRRKRCIERRKTWSTPPRRHLHYDHRSNSQQRITYSIHRIFAIRLQMRYWNLSIYHSFTRSW